MQNYEFVKFGPKRKMPSNFYEIWHLEEMGHTNDE